MSDYSQFPNSSSLALDTGEIYSDEDSLHLALTVARTAEDRKGGDIVLLRVSEVSYLADYFAIVTAFSKVQVRAISDAIIDKVEQEFHRHPVRVEGQANASWLVQDYGDVIVHIMMPHEREYYNIEAFWAHGERIALTAANSGERVGK